MSDKCIAKVFEVSWLIEERQKNVSLDWSVNYMFNIDRQTDR